MESAIREAEAGFGDGRVLIEKLIASPRHIELQVFADAHGACVHLYERDCSAQRRHQKVVEECPAPGLPDETRAAMAKAAIEAALAAGYVGAGTVEFIADPGRALKPQDFYFLEMNTRLQVEHPVTEAVTGLDLVEWQFRVAAGEPLPRAQDEIACAGAAIEARVYAEDPEHNFLPSTGRIHLMNLKGEEGLKGVRVDTGVAAGDSVSPYYDPMIAKLIAHARTAPRRWRRSGRSSTTLSSSGRRPISPSSTRFSPAGNSQPGRSTPDSSTQILAASAPSRIHRTGAPSTPPR